MTSHVVNKKIDEAIFDELYEKIVEYYNTDDSKTYLFDGFAGFDPTYSINVRILAKRAWQAHFVHNMFIRPETPEQLINFSPDFTIINASSVFNEKFKDLCIFINFDRTAFTRLREFPRVHS